MARPNEPPVLLAKWYDLTKWLLARIESFPKSQRQRDRPARAPA